VTALAAAGIAMSLPLAQDGRGAAPAMNESTKPPRNGMPRFGPRWGGNRHPGGRAQMLERLDHMPPEQRDRVLERLPAERRQRVERQLEQYHNMTPEQRARLQQRYERFSELPPERQEAMRKGFHRFQTLPADRQDAVREEIQHLRAMSESERQARMSSDEFRSRYDKREQQIIGDMTAALPSNSAR
jgi:Spy/CpxP family protein refolding chaperone